MRWKFIIIALIAYGAYQHFKHREVHHGAGEIAPNMPIQTETQAPARAFKNFTINPLADYEIEARVLSREDYSMGTEAELSPTDLALGWGPMSDESVLEKISISQGNRFFFWHVDEFPIPQREIEIHAANTHIIPANDTVRAQLKAVRKGQVVHITGQLIEAKKENWTWHSSLTREDTGNGACEILFAETLTAR